MHKVHFDHQEELNPYDVVLSQSLNSLIKMKGVIAKEIARYESAVKDEKLGALRQKAVEKVKEGYALFKLALKNHLLNCVRDIRNSQYVNRLKEQQRRLAVDRPELLKSMLKEMKTDLTALMDAVYEDKYSGQITRVNRISYLKSKLLFLEKAQACERKNLESSVEELKQVNVNMVRLDDWFKIKNLDEIDISVYKVSRQHRTIAKYSIHTFTLNWLQFNKFTPPYNSSIVEYKGLVYIIGGSFVEGTPKDSKAFSDIVTEIDPMLNSTRIRGKLLTRRMCFGAVVSNNGHIYIAGGYNHTKQIDECEIFSLPKGTSIELPPLIDKKSNCALCLIKERYLYCIGGYTIENESVSIDRLDLEVKKWERIINKSNDLWQATQNAGAVATTQKEILIFGGKSGDGTINDAIIFTTDDYSFRKVGSMQDCDTFLACRPLLYKGHLYTFGCHEDNLHIYNLKEETWEIKANIAMTEEKSQPEDF